MKKGKPKTELKTKRTQSASAQNEERRIKRNETQRKYYAAHKHWWRNYYLRNIKKFKEREKNRPKRKRIDKRRNRIDKRRWRDRPDKKVESSEMKRGYMVKLMKDAGYTIITDDAINAYRALLLLKREIKKHDKERGN